MKTWRIVKSKNVEVNRRRIEMYCDVLNRVCDLRTGYDDNRPCGSTTVSAWSSARQLWLLEFGNMDGFSI